VITAKSARQFNNSARNNYVVILTQIGNNNILHWLYCTIR